MPRKRMPKVGEQATVYCRVSYRNEHGGTSELDLGEDGSINVPITKRWHDYETGWRFIGNAEGREVYFGEFDLDQKEAQESRALLARQMANIRVVDWREMFEDAP